MTKNKKKRGGENTNNVTLQDLTQPVNKNQPPISEQINNVVPFSATSSMNPYNASKTKLGSGNENVTHEKNKIFLNYINENSCFYILLIILIILVIGTLAILFPIQNSSKSTTEGAPASQKITANIFIVLCVVLLIFILAIVLLPSLKDFKNFLVQISNVLYVVLYTIFLILLFRLVPIDTINKYSSPITLITLLIAGYMFYKAFQQNYAENFNINYERIKILILFFCLLTLFILYYTTDPGNLITKYFGYTLVITILLTVFTLIYLIILLTYSTNSSSSSTNENGNFLSNFTRFSVWGSILFIAFLITVTVGIYTSGILPKINEIPSLATQSTIPTDSEWNMFSDKASSAAVLILVLLSSITWVIMLVVNMYPEIFKTNGLKTIENIEFLRRALLVLFGLIISALIIAWVSYNIQHFTGNSTNITQIILNIFLIIVVLYLIYKTVIVQLPFGNSKKNAFFNMVVNIIFYIPCLVMDTLHSIMSFFVEQYNITTTRSLLLLLLAIVLLTCYFLFPFIYNKINLQGGELLVNNPVYTNTNYPLGTYKDLNGSDNFDYQYAISFWFFLDAVPPNNNSNSPKYTSILNFGNKPNVLYNTFTNSLIVTMQNEINVENKTNTNVNNNVLTNTDENGNAILYKKDDVLLQKWNNMIINYNGGVMDIFLNGELVKSISGVVPYYKLDNLTIGEDNGINGGICNVVYYKKPLTSIQMYYLYNMVKNSNPPITEQNDLTIIKDKMTINTHSVT